MSFYSQASQKDRDKYDYLLLLLRVTNQLLAPYWWKVVKTKKALPFNEELCRRKLVMIKDSIEKQLGELKSKELVRLLFHPE